MEAVGEQYKTEKKMRAKYIWPWKRHDKNKINRKLRYWDGKI